MDLPPRLHVIGAADAVSTVAVRILEQLARGWEIVTIDEFEEGKLPRRLSRVALRRPTEG